MNLAEIKAAAEAGDYPRVLWLVERVEELAEALRTFVVYAEAYDVWGDTEDRDIQATWNEANIESGRAALARLEGEA